MNHKNGKPTFASFKIVEDQYFESDDALTFAEFQREVGKSTYEYGG